MKYFAGTIAWFLYGLGHLVSRLDRFDSERLAAAWYPVYNRCMLWSVGIQGPGDFGPWKPQDQLEGSR
jgi:hypothetical protein